VFAGRDPWAYGIEPNRATLEAQQRYLYRDGLIEKPFPIEELFAPL
jgi:4,5-dihydroxyphthalate decarboxylase